MMRKTTWLKIINPAIFLLMISQGVTGMLRDQLHLQSEEAFGIAHGLLGMLLIVLALAHLLLNWSWVKTQFFAKRNKIPRQSMAEKEAELR